MHLADEHWVMLNEMKAFIKDNPSPYQTKFGPQHEISNSVVCATSKCLDRPAQMCSLIRAFASRLIILRLLGH